MERKFIDEKNVMTLVLSLLSKLELDKGSWSKECLGIQTHL
jgi:hypothetical protein